MLESKLNFAAIDIGSNAVRLLIKGIRLLQHILFQQALLYAISIAL